MSSLRGCPNWRQVTTTPQCARGVAPDTNSMKISRPITTTQRRGRAHRHDAACTSSLEVYAPFTC
eukprot:15461050-Alexandrium_andersonii.AAC.1